MRRAAIIAGGLALLCLLAGGCRWVAVPQKPKKERAARCQGC